MSSLGLVRRRGLIFLGQNLKLRVQGPNINPRTTFETTRNLKLNNILITCFAFWESSSAILSSNAVFFDGTTTRTRIYITYSRYSLDVVQARCHSCARPTTGAWLLAHISTLSFILCPFFYNTPYLSQYTTFYSSASFTMSVSSYHRWFGYPFVTLHVWEWVHCNPWYALKYHCSYHIGEWSSRTKRDFSPFPSPLTKTSGYCHH